MIGSVLRILPALSITCGAETHKLALHPFFFSFLNYKRFKYYLDIVTRDFFLLS